MEVWRNLAKRKFVAKPNFKDNVIYLERFFRVSKPIPNGYIIVL